MAQLSKTSYKALYGSSGTTFPDNVTEEISEGDMRQFGEDQADSFMSLSDNFIDEDSFASDSATKAPSQQSTKAYIDTKFSTNSWQIVEVSLSSAEILALFTTPKQLVASPGAGFGIVVSHVVFRYDGNGVGYATNTTMRVYLGSVSTPIITDETSILPNSANRVYSSMAISYGNTTISSNHILLTVLTGNPTAGNGTLKVEVVYRIVSAT